MRALEAAQQYLNELVAGLAAKGIQARPITVYGKPEEHIAEAANVHEADVTVISIPGRSGVSR